MSESNRRWLWLLAIPPAAAALCVLLPLAAPFLVGLLLALAAEPVVRVLTERAGLGRGWSAGIGVSVTLALLMLLIVLLLGLLVRQLAALTGMLPALAESIRNGMASLSDTLLDLAQRAPEGIRGLVTRQIRNLFSDGSALLERGLDAALKLASGLLSRVPGGAITFATAILSAYMISAKLPKLRTLTARWISVEKLRPVRELWCGLKGVILGWLKAQLKLSAVTALVVLVGFWVLRIPRALFWAPLIGLVDAVPVLGTGTVLIPWSLISFLQGDRFLAFALLGVYGAAALIRSALEPRLVGRHLGLDPLVTLMALYIGYRAFGLPGMLLAPLAAVMTAQLISEVRQKKS